MTSSCLQTNGHVTSVIERPETTEAKHWTQQALSVQTAQPPSVQMNSDVRAIAQRERAKLKEAKQVRQEMKTVGNEEVSAQEVHLDGWSSH